MAIGAQLAPIGEQLILGAGKDCEPRAVDERHSREIDNDLQSAIPAQFVEDRFERRRGADVEFTGHRHDPRESSSRCETVAENAEFIGGIMSAKVSANLPGSMHRGYRQHGVRPPIASKVPRTGRSGSVLRDRALR